jgi:hypothetical protein
LRHLTLLALALTFACNGPTKSDDTDVATDTDDTVAGDTDGTQGGDTDVAGEDTDLPGDPNAKAVGTWTLSTAASTCTMNFAGDWTGAVKADSTTAFTLTQAIDAGQTLSCLFDAVNPSQFTCANVTTGGVIPPNCNVSAAITSVTGTVSGTAASLSTTIQVTSPNCGQALNCGPLPHSASGSIAR